MFESLQHLMNGFGIATTINNLLYCLIGAIVGTLIGVLPGIGPIAGIALLIPATFGLNPTSAIIMLAHNPPLLARWSGIEELGASSYPLGMLEDVTYREGELELSPGEMLVAYSDGLTEAQNESGQFYGLDRLKTLCAQLNGASAQAMGERVVAEVARFEGNARRNDDLSLVILQKC